MAVLNDRIGPLTFGDFGANDDYCNKTYPPGTSPQIDSWNQKCKKSCSGMSCVSNPGLLAKPWTIVGKQTRGLPDDSFLGQAIGAAQGLVGGRGGGGGGGGPPPPSGGGSMSIAGMGIDTNMLLLGGGALALFFFMKSQRGGRRGFGSFGSPKGRKHRGWKRRGRRLGR